LRVEGPIDPVRKPRQCGLSGQVFRHPRQGVALAVGQLLAPLHDQVAVLEHELRLLFDRQAAACRGRPGLGALAAPLLLVAGFAEPIHGRPQAPQNIQDQGIDLLDHVEDAESVSRVGPRFTQHGRLSRSAKVF
jgi:hypothetical protein